MRLALGCGFPRWFAAQHARKPRGCQPHLRQVVRFFAARDRTLSEIRDTSMSLSVSMGIPQHQIEGPTPPPSHPILFSRLIPRAHSVTMVSEAVDHHEFEAPRHL
jgi:hypothetical protein